MTVTAIPASGARPASYAAAKGDRVLPGCYGISRGLSITGDLIRPVTGSRPGHAFIYIGHGRVVEVAPPGVRIAPVASHPDALWNARFPLTGAQRQRICARALSLVGRPYDYPAYTGFALKVLKLRDDADLDPVFKADHWQVCSSMVADCYASAGIRLEPGLKDLSLDRPAGLDTRAARPA